MNEEPQPCKKCKKLPRFVCIDGLYYAQCSERCDKWGAYAHLGITKAACIRNWNLANSRNANIEDIL